MQVHNTFWKSLPDVWNFVELLGKMEALVAASRISRGPMSYHKLILIRPIYPGYFLFGTYSGSLIGQWARMTLRERGHFQKFYIGSTPNGRPELRTVERPRLQLCTALYGYVLSKPNCQAGASSAYLSRSRLVRAMKSDDILTRFRHRPPLIHVCLS